MAETQEKIDKIAKIQELKKKVQQLDTQLESDVMTRLNGIQSEIVERGGFKKVGYKILRDFFDGDQWSYAKPDNGTMRTYNYCATTVHNYTAFLAGETPEFDVPAIDINDDIEVAYAEARENVLKDILKRNKFTILFEEAVMIGSELGDSFIIGPFYNKYTKQIWFSPIKKPEQIRPIFSARDYNELVGFIYHFRLTEDKARSLWRDELKNVDLSPYLSGQAGETQNKMLDVVQYWDDKEMILLLGGGDNSTAGSLILDYDEHNWGFIPLQYVRNIIDPNGPFGVSDMEIMLDAQVEYNESASYTSDVLRAAALPHIFGKNLEISEFTAGSAQILDLGDESEIFANPMAGISAPWEAYGNSRQRDVWGLSGINEIMYGGPRVREATGRALSVLMQGVQNRIRGRQERWKVALQDLVAGIFRLIEIYIPNGKDLIQQQYNVDIFFPSTLVRNVSEEINKFNAKLQSQTTTMKNMGVPSPHREKKLINKELKDPVTMIEISRNPGLQMQLIQQLAQANQAQQGQQASPGQLTEGEEEGEGIVNSQGQTSPTNAGNAAGRPPAQINE